MSPGPKVGLSLPRFRIQTADHHRRIPAPGVVHHRGEPRRLGRARLTDGAAPPLGFRFRRSRGRGAKGCAAHDLLESPTHTVCHTLTHSCIVCCCIQNVLCCTQGVSLLQAVINLFLVFSSCKKSPLQNPPPKAKLGGFLDRELTWGCAPGPPARLQPVDKSCH